MTRLGDVHLPLRGVHNVVNATGAIAMALALGATFDDCRDALGRFGGVARRFDIRGVDGGATFVDDYGHLPAEIAAVVAAARDSGDGWQRVVVAFQPNRFNRIAEMWQEYADAFVGADVVVITDIYPSGTTPIPGVTGKLIVNAVVDAHPRARASCGCRGATTSCRSSPARSVRATCASRWAAATSPRCPRRSSARRVAPEAVVSPLARRRRRSTPPPPCSARGDRATCRSAR